MKSRPSFTRRPWVEELESRLVPSTLSYSYNWSGYAVSTGGGAVSSVSGTWTVPTVSGSGTSYAASWVGMDGWSSSTVEQIGTESDLSNGHPVYYAWYEMYPAYPVNLSMTIHPGDTMSATVSFSAPSQFTLSIQDVTSGAFFSVNKTLSGAQRSSAEWIVEAPSSFFGVLPLAPFGTENFSNARATVNGVAGPIDNAGNSVQQVNMISRSGAQIDSTSGLTDSGSPTTSAFSVTFTGSTSSSSGGHHHRGGFFSPDISSSQTTSIDPSVFNSASGLMPHSANVMTAGSSLMTASSSPVAVPNSVAVAPSGFSFVPNTAILVGGSLPASDDNATNSGTAPGAVMPPVPSAGEQLDAPQATPNAAPMPPVEPEEAAILPGTPAALQQVCDACFAKGDWTPTATTEEPGSVLVAPSEGSTTTWEAAAGFLFTLSLGGAWGLARRGDLRRRWHLRSPRA